MRILWVCMGRKFTNLDYHVILKLARTEVDVVIFLHETRSPYIHMCIESLCIPFTEQLQIKSSHQTIACFQGGNLTNIYNDDHRLMQA